MYVRALDVVERPHCRTIYRIFTRDEWQQALAHNHFSGNELDRRDGFIHLSSREQVAGTLDKYFSDTADVVIAEIDAVMLGENLRWEPSRDGQLFPHLYGTLPLTAIVRTLDRLDF